MNIPEAIGILEEEGAIAKLHKATGKQEALLLGIEAMERLKALREGYTEFSDIHILRDHITCLLPSETEGV